MFTSTLEKIAMLEVYIHIRKNKEVRIMPPTNHRQQRLLDKAYDYAVKWMEAYNTRISSSY